MHEIFILIFKHKASEKKDLYVLRYL